MIPFEQFTDKVYFDIKELYEDAEEAGFPGNYNTENDGDTFGWALTDSWFHLGNVYYFLLSVFNLVETSKDSSPIIDTKGSIQGKLTYTVNFELFDVDKTTKLNPLEFETLNELVGKNLKLKVELKKATDIPDKYCYRTMCKYDWSDGQYETKVVEKAREPSFDYHGEHMHLITDDMIQHMMYNTLTISVFGMVESKRSQKKNEDEDESFLRELNRLKTQRAFESTGDVDIDKRIIQLEK